MNIKKYFDLNWWCDRFGIERPDYDPDREGLALGYPPALAKACYDQYDYALKLKTGEMWYFESAVALSREWVRLQMSDASMYDSRSSVQESPRPSFRDRGVEVRVSDIVWVADAPFGS